MRSRFLTILFSALVMFCFYENVGMANESKKDEHKHEKGEKQEGHGKEGDEKHDDHDHGSEEGEKHDDHDEGGGHGGHGHEEGNENIGPGKGIVSASEEEGFQISPEAEKNFDVKKVQVPASAQFEIPKTAIVTAGTEVNLYRYRDSHYKRVDFIFVSKSDKKAVIKSKDLKAGDQIVVEGTGLLRIAEIAAFGGAPEGHSH